MPWRVQMGSMRRRRTMRDSLLLRCVRTVDARCTCVSDGPAVVIVVPHLDVPNPAHIPGLESSAEWHALGAVCDWRDVRVTRVSARTFVVADR
jgi:hypothetical protein